MTVLALCVFKPAERDTVFHTEFNMSVPEEGTTLPTFFIPQCTLMVDKHN